MAQAIDSMHKEWMLIIGNHVRKLRKENSKFGYIEFSEKLGMDKKTYYRIEMGAGDFNFSNLAKIISYYYPNLSFSKFFLDAGL